MRDQCPGLFPKIRASSSSDQQQTAFVELTLEDYSNKMIKEDDGHGGMSPIQLLGRFWAAVLSDYIGSNAVSFGVLAEQDPVELEHWVGHVDLEQPFPLAVRLECLSTPSIGDVQFNTVLHWRKRTASWKTCPFTETDLLNIGIILVAVDDPDALHIELHYRCSILGATEAQDVITTLGSLMNESQSPTTRPVVSYSIPERHRLQLQLWSRQSPGIVIDDCIHDLFQLQAAKQPWKQAVCAWDGTFTYEEVECFSNTIATELHANVNSDSIVPIYIPKSKWVVVAILGVLKAGAAFVLLDISYPAARLRDICDDIQPSVIICFNESPIINHSMRKVIIGDEVLQHNNPAVSLTLGQLSVSSRNAAYISFTSGSTGRPKGVIIEHKSFCTNALATSRAHRLDSNSRVLQYASFAFDVSILECLVPLLLGGCTCIPSNHQRMNSLAEACNELQVNWAELTPSVARMLQPSEVPRIQTLVLGGEPILKTDIDQWRHISLICAYGPAECTIVSTVQRKVTEPGNIGHCYGGSAWIVDKENHDRLLPIGPIGELVIGGPIVGRGYLNRPVQTEAAFVSVPAWGSLFGLDPGKRLYKTGDLARYAADGSIIYCDRKDTQVKIHGQRVELGEIESHARKYLVDRGVVVELAGGNERSFLVLFLACARQTEDPDSSKSLFLAPENDFYQLIKQLKAALRSVLPAHMVPTTYIPICQIPLSPTGKVDRKLLRNSVNGLTMSQLRQYRSCRKGETAARPRAPTEMILRQLVATVLGIPESHVVSTGNFLELGGDSISAISLMNDARSIGWKLTVTSVMQADSISTLATKMRQVQNGCDIQYQPFSLISEDKHSLVQQAAAQCQISPIDIEDIYPCTPLQEAMIGYSLRKPGSFEAHFSFSLPVTIDLPRFWEAWNKVISAHPILRTRIVQLHLPHALQVVVRPIQAQQEKSYSDKAMGVGSPLMKLSMTASGLFSLTMHHALFDQWSYDLILEEVEATYRGQPVMNQPSYGPFIKHTIDSTNQRAMEFWKSEYRGLSMRHFPSPPPTVELESSSIKSIQRSIPVINWPRGHFTRTTVVRLAYSILIAQVTQSLDVVFGVTLNGRNASVPGLDKLAAPTISTIPLRVVLQGKESVQKTLTKMQEHAAKLIPYEQTGLRWIKTCSPEAASACQFQSLLVVQQHAEKSSLPSLFKDPLNDGQLQSSFSTHPITIVCNLAHDRISVTVFYELALVSKEFAQALIQRLDELIYQIANNLAEPMSKLLDSPAAGLLMKQSSPTRALDSWVAHAGFNFHPGDMLKRTVSTLWNYAPGSSSESPVSEALKEPSLSQVPAIDHLRTIVASVLQLEPDEITTDDDFFTLGGDSTTAMQLVMRCRAENLTLTVRDIFAEKTMSCIAATLQPLPTAPEALLVNSDNERFPLLKMTSDEERIFETKVKQQLGITTLDLVEDAYPCTAVHEGLLRTQLLEPMTHKSFTVWEVSSNTGAVSSERLCEAWKTVSRRHAALRTVLVDNCLPGRTWTKVQIVLHDPASVASVYTDVSEDDCQVSNLNFPSDCVPYHFSVYQTTKNGVFCKLEGTQAFLDSRSISTILGDLVEAYNNNLSTDPGPPYSSVVKALEPAANQTSSVAYWKSQMALAQPCIFPHLRGNNDLQEDTLRVTSQVLSKYLNLHRFCANQGFTLNTVLQVAWALTLQHYTGQDSVVFGALVAGRDSLLFSRTDMDIDQVVGSFFNVLPCRLDLGTDAKDSVHVRPHLVDILRENQLETANRLSHQHCSLLEILRHSPYYGQRVFNTCFSLEESLSSNAPDDGIRFVEKDTQEPTEYSLLLTCIDNGAESAMQARLTYWSSVLSEEQALEVLQVFENRVCEIMALRN